MRCPACTSLDDKVVDSRTADDGTAIRRRRECLECGTRFTTFERLEELPLIVVKRSGDQMAFERDRIVAALREAGIEASVLAPSYDVDRPEDLERFRRELSLRDSDDADYPRATAAALAGIRTGRGT